jgi:hypothetical protein
MPLDAPLNFEQFSKELSESFSHYDNYGIECSASNAKKLAKLPELATRLLEEEKKASNVVLVRKIKSEIASIHAMIEEHQKNVITDCYKIYINTFESKVPILLGTADLRTASSEDELINFGLISDGLSSCPSSLISRISETQKGGIFCPRSWSLIKNDVFIQAILHAGHSVGLAAPLGIDDLWESTLNRPKVLAREIVMLISGGYVQIVGSTKVPDYGYLFEETTIDCDLSLKSLLAKASKVHKISDILNILNPYDI